MKNKILLILTGLGVLLLSPFQASAVDWPGTGGCAGSLQVCIDAQPAGGIVTVKTNGIALSGGPITINKRFILQAGVGYNPILRNVAITLDVPANERVTFKGFELEQESLINANVSSGSELNIISNNWTSPSTVTGENEGIRVIANVAVGNEAVVNIHRNNLLGENNDTSYGLLDIWSSSSSEGRLKANIHDNHITVLDLNPAYVEAVYTFSSGGIMDLQFVANQVRGGEEQFKFGQGVATASLNLGLVSNLFTGVIDANNTIASSLNNAAISSSVSAGNFSGVIGNNTIDGVASNGSGAGLDFNGHTTTGFSTFAILNNIVVNVDQAYAGPATGTSTSETSNGNNIFFNHSTISGLSLIASDLNAPPVFVQEGINYALKGTSPAIDKANSTGASLFYGTGFMTGSPIIDADGLRRYKGPMIDAGAYEWGDRHIFHRATSPVVNETSIGDAALDSNADAMTITTQVWGYGSGTSYVYNDKSIGIYRASGTWRVFNQVTDMPTNAEFHVFYPYGDDNFGLDGLLSWNAPGGAATGFELNGIFLDNNPNQRIFVSQLWDSSAGGVYNPHPIEIGYKNSTNEWYLGNADGINMPANAQFMTYNQDASRNVFKHYVTEANTIGHVTLIDHPLLNDNPCALPTVTQSTSWLFAPLFEQNPHNIGVYYAGSRWAIFNQDSADIDIVLGAGSPVVGGVFNVMVDPQQVYVCDDIIFKNGFD